MEKNPITPILTKSFRSFGFVVLIFLPLLFQFVLMPKENAMAAGENSSLDLSPQSISAEAGEVFEVSIRVNSDGASVCAVNIDLDFDYTRLQLENVALNVGGARLSMIDLGKGVFFVTKSGSSFPDSFELATLRFRVVGEEETAIGFNFSNGDRRYSNLVDESNGAPILSSVGSIEINALADVAPPGLPLIDSLERIINPIIPKNFQELIERIIALISYLALAIAPLMIIIAAFYFLTSAGDLEKIKTAKRIILYTFIGLAVILLARTIIAVIEGILG